jgi:monoamine oxidase
MVEKGLLSAKATGRAFDPNERRTVAIVGSGVAGLTAAYLAAKAGFRVVVFEGDDRYGGRSLTVRPSDAAYREWWFDKYNPNRLFPRMYVSSYQESDRSPDPAPQVANMAIETWPSTNEPVELFLNAGPGRIPSNHSALLDLCQAVNVRLEPYIFLSASNLLSKPTSNTKLCLTCFVIIF